MPTVLFLPSQISVEIPAGALIHEAAIKGGIEELHLPCGAKGTCGQCLVEILEGNPQQLGHTHLEESLRIKGVVMACQTRVHENLVIRIPEKKDDSLRVQGDSHLLINEDLLPTRSEIIPLSYSVELQIPPASIEEHYSDWQRLCRALPANDGAQSVTAGLHLLSHLAENMRNDDGKITVHACEEDNGLHLLSVDAGHHREQLYGLAIDIGTTTCAMQLVSLTDGRVLANESSYNAQISRGSDVISRIDYARTPERQHELRKLILETLNSLLAEIVNTTGIAEAAIHCAFIAGNTTMIHLLLGLPPRYIRESPYVPTVNTVPTFTAMEVGLYIHPQAVITFAPGVGSYVGGDITSGLLCTELAENNEQVYLFLDIGTNGEIVLGNADWLVTCACSAGPAFEGSGIKCGMRATDGAIEYVDISADGNEISYDVIGNGRPSGLCGSGLISLLGELFLRGIVDQSGRFHGDSRLIETTEHGRAFRIAEASATWEKAALYITEADIENLMRTKAAIYSACALLLANVGLDWEAISRVYIAGGFGRYIQLEDAILIGLLPDLPHEKFHYIGNAALTGAYISLLSRKGRQQLQQIANRMTYIDLSSDIGYMDSYLAALFLPHTEMQQFPSVIKKLAEVKNSQ